jgi:hypothetical protein
MNGESINQSFLLITDPNLIVILNDPMVTTGIKNIIVKLTTDRLYTSKLSNLIQPDDFKLESKKQYLQDQTDLFNRFLILINESRIRRKDFKRFIKYLKYVKKVF